MSRGLDPLRKAEGMRRAQAVLDLILAAYAPVTIAAMQSDQSENILTITLVPLAIMTSVPPIRKSGLGDVNRYVHDETRIAFQRHATTIGFWVALAAALAAGLFASFVAPISAIYALHVVVASGLAAMWFTRGVLEVRAGQRA